MVSTPKEVPTKQSRGDKPSPSALNSSVHNIYLNSKDIGTSDADLFTSFRPIRDSLQTRTSILQEETVEECLPLLTGSGELQQDSTGRRTGGIPRLERDKHIKFLRQSLEKLAAGYVGFDASRPWILYWVLAGLSLLAEDVQVYRER